MVKQFRFSIIGEEKALSIKVGAQAGDPSTEDIIVVRGSSADVDRAIAEILKIVEDAKNDEIVNSYVSVSVSAPNMSHLFMSRVVNGV
jgi:hypothetical protein